MRRVYLVGVVALAVVASAGCASAIMEGAQPVTGPPAAAMAVCSIPRCTVVATRAPAAGPQATYYLARVGQGMALYELDAQGKGAMITNQWYDGKAYHFLTYQRTSHAWEYVVPRDLTRPVRYVYLAGSYQPASSGGVIRVTGQPAVACPMVCRAAGAPAARAPAPMPGAAPGMQPAGGCTRDVDCPGEDVCEGGRCVPGAGGAAAPGAAPPGTGGTDAPPDGMDPDVPPVPPPPPLSH